MAVNNNMFNFFLYSILPYVLLEEITHSIDLNYITCLRVVLFLFLPNFVTIKSD